MASGLRSLGGNARRIIPTAQSAPQPAGYQTDLKMEQELKQLEKQERQLQRAVEAAKAKKATVSSSSSSSSSTRTSAEQPIPATSTSSAVDVLKNLAKMGALKIAEAKKATNKSAAPSASSVKKPAVVNESENDLPLPTMYKHFLAYADFVYPYNVAASAEEANEQVEELRRWSALYGLIENYYPNLPKNVKKELHNLNRIAARRESQKEEEEKHLGQRPDKTLEKAEKKFGITNLFIATAKLNTARNNLERLQNSNEKKDFEAQRKTVEFLEQVHERFQWTHDYDIYLKKLRWRSNKEREPYDYDYGDDEEFYFYDEEILPDEDEASSYDERFAYLGGQQHPKKMSQSVRNTDAETMLKISQKKQSKPTAASIAREMEADENSQFEKMMRNTDEETMLKASRTNKQSKQTAASLAREMEADEMANMAKLSKADQEIIESFSSGALAPKTSKKKPKKPVIITKKATKKTQRPRKNLEYNADQVGFIVPRARIRRFIAEQAGQMEGFNENEPRVSSRFVQQLNTNLQDYVALVMEGMNLTSLSAVKGGTKDGANCKLKTIRVGPMRAAILLNNPVFGNPAGENGEEDYLTAHIEEARSYMALTRLRSAMLAYSPLGTTQVSSDAINLLASAVYLRMHFIIFDLLEALQSKGRKTLTSCKPLTKPFQPGGPMLEGATESMSPTLNDDEDEDEEQNEEQDEKKSEQEDESDENNVEDNLTEEEEEEEDENGQSGATHTMGLGADENENEHLAGLGDSATEEEDSDDGSSSDEDEDNFQEDDYDGPSATRPFSF